MPVKAPEPTCINIEKGISNYHIKIVKGILKKPSNTFLKVSNIADVSMFVGLFDIFSCNLGHNRSAPPPKIEPAS